MRSLLILHSNNPSLPPETILKKGSSFMFSLGFGDVDPLVPTSKQGDTIFGVFDMTPLRVKLGVLGFDSRGINLCYESGF